MPVPIRPWSGQVFRHIPTASPFGPLDTRFVARSTENRWNAAGEPTLYFASDLGVISGELGRHFRQDRAPQLPEFVSSRQVFAIQLQLQRVLDLRDPDATAALGIAGAPAAFLDRQRARATASFARHVLGAEALRAPSAVSLDDPSRWNLVLFLDRLQTSLDDIVLRVEKSGVFTLEMPGQSTD